MKILFHLPNYGAANPVWSKIMSSLAISSWKPFLSRSNWSISGSTAVYTAPLKKQLKNWIWIWKLCPEGKSILKKNIPALKTCSSYFWEVSHFWDFILPFFLIFEICIEQSCHKYHKTGLFFPLSMLAHILLITKNIKYYWYI